MGTLLLVDPIVVFDARRAELVQALSHILRVLENICAYRAKEALLQFVKRFHVYDRVLLLLRFLVEEAWLCNHLVEIQI